MKRLFDYVVYELGTPQFRIQTDYANEERVPLYYFYGQQEVENDLGGIDSFNRDVKSVRTKDKVCTVEEGDIVFSLISGKAALIRENHAGYLLTQNYVKLSPKKNIDSAFLVYLLNEDKMIRRQFVVGMQGSIVMKYTVTQLRELKIPKLPSQKKQRLIGELYLSQLRYEALLREKAVAQRTIILANIEKSIE